jgi:hypothetical protein
MLGEEEAEEEKKKKKRKMFCHVASSTKEIKST